MTTATLWQIWFDVPYLGDMGARGLTVLLVAVSALPIGCVTSRDASLRRAEREMKSATRAQKTAALRRKQIYESPREVKRWRVRRKVALREQMRAEVPPERSRVLAVLEVRDPYVELDTQSHQQLSRYLAMTVLARTSSRIVAPDRMRAALIDEKTKSYRACHDEACQIELGRALAADRMLDASIIVHDGACTFGVTLYDLRTETAIWASSVPACTMKELLVGADQFARELATFEREAS